MLRIRTLVTAVLIAGLSAAAAAENVYKWVDSSGQIHYTDLPPRQSGARVLGVYQQQAGVVAEDDEDYDDAGSDEPPDDGAPPEGAPRTPEPPVSQEAMAAAEADAAKARVEQCKAAQDRYQRYVESRRLFRETPDGKRVYLTDQELTEARARARQAVSDYCD